MFEKYVEAIYTAPAALSSHQTDSEYKHFNHSSQWLWSPCFQLVFRLYLKSIKAQGYKTTEVFFFCEREQIGSKLSKWEEKAKQRHTLKTLQINNRPSLVSGD